MAVVFVSESLFFVMEAKNATLDTEFLPVKYRGVRVAKNPRADTCTCKSYEFSRAKDHSFRCKHLRMADRLKERVKVW